MWPLPKKEFKQWRCRIFGPWLLKSPETKTSLMMPQTIKELGKTPFWGKFLWKRGPTSNNEKNVRHLVRSDFYRYWNGDSIDISRIFTIFPNFPGAREYFTTLTKMSLGPVYTWQSGFFLASVFFWANLKSIFLHFAKFWDQNWYQIFFFSHCYQNIFVAL